MSLLSDGYGNMDFLDFDGVNLREAVLSVVFFTAVASALSNFSIQVPFPNGIVTMADVLTSFSLPVVPYTATFTIGITISLVLLAWEVLEASKGYGSSSSYEIKNYVNSVPTGLTVVLVGSFVILISALIGFGPVMSFINSNYWYQFGSISIETLAYWAISSQR